MNLQTFTLTSKPPYRDSRLLHTADKALPCNFTDKARPAQGCKRKDLVMR